MYLWILDSFLKFILSLKFPLFFRGILSIGIYFVIKFSYDMRTKSCSLSCLGIVTFLGRYLIHGELSSWLMFASLGALITLNVV
jgi:hypothetical protein